MSDDKNVRHRFTVPAADERVNEWILAQSNLGFSLRILIKAFIREYGIRDATCMELGVSVRKKGRPAKTAQVRLLNLDNEDSDDLEEQDNAENAEIPSKTEPIQQPSVQSEAQTETNITEQFDMNKLGL